MARVGNKNQLRGAIGPVIFQERYGKSFTRIKPDKIRQTNATKVSSSEFQYCSTWSKWIRIGLKPLWLGNTDPLVSQKLSGALYAALQKNTALPKGQRNWSNTDMSSLKGFEVNSQSPFESYCKADIGVELTVSRTLKITLPEMITAQTIRYTEDCTDAEVICSITANNLAAGELISTVAEHFTIPKSSTTLDSSLFESQPLPTDCMIIVAAQLVFFKCNRINGRYALNSKKINPSVILWARV
ncbi:hypothetical protein [Flavobacterium sp. N1994]|uniref:hypothetical protein n=1 Tax=Flavobacterium sp. N1994 TaxID=2986827 RepID=UPI0022226EC4|nr:hypothetical protein [Flavobacterium sp. N1994]